MPIFQLDIRPNSRNAGTVSGTNFGDDTSELSSPVVPTFERSHMRRYKLTEMIRDKSDCPNSPDTIQADGLESIALVSKAKAGSKQARAAATSTTTLLSSTSITVDANFPGGASSAAQAAGPPPPLGGPPPPLPKGPSSSSSYKPTSQTQATSVSPLTTAAATVTTTLVPPIEIVSTSKHLDGTAIAIIIIIVVVGCIIFVIGGIIIRRFIYLKGTTTHSPQSQIPHSPIQPHYPAVVTTLPEIYNPNESCILSYRILHPSSYLSRISNGISSFVLGDSSGHTSISTVRYDLSHYEHHLTPDTAPTAAAMGEEGKPVLFSVSQIGDERREKVKATVALRGRATEVVIPAPLMAKAKGKSEKDEKGECTFSAILMPEQTSSVWRGSANTFGHGLGGLKAICDEG